MNCRATFSASSLEATSTMAYPPMTSLVSVNGPSVTPSFPPRKRTRKPSAVGRSPAVSFRIPLLKDSVTNSPMASIKAWGMGSVL